MNPWSVLQIEPTTDEKAIKRAYAAQVKKNNPEINPQGFMALREAYELILKSRKAMLENKEDKSRPAPYLAELLQLYQDMEQRKNKNAWIRTFESMPFADLEAFEREAATFFNQYFHVPYAVWNYVVNRFELLQNPDFERREYTAISFLFSFEMFDRHTSWDYERYIELRYRGARHYYSGEHEAALKCLTEAYQIYSEDVQLNGLLHCVRMVLGQEAERPNAEEELDLDMLLAVNVDAADRQRYNAIMKQIVEQIIGNANGEAILRTMGENLLGANGFVLLHEAILLYLDRSKRLSRSAWEKLIKEKNNDLLFREWMPHFLNVCYHFPMAVWSCFLGDLLIDLNPVFKRRDMYTDFHQFSFEFTGQGENWDYTEYVELRYLGMTAWSKHDSETAARYLLAACRLYSGEKMVIQACLDSLQTLGRHKEAKMCCQWAWKLPEEPSGAASAAIDLSETMEAIPVKKKNTWMGLTGNLIYLWLILFQPVGKEDMAEQLIYLFCRQKKWKKAGILFLAYTSVRNKNFALVQCRIEIYRVISPEQLLVAYRRIGRWKEKTIIAGIALVFVCILVFYCGWGWRLYYRIG